ncbi:hypothetical protein QAD02_015249 [Eretmocerus hayati]|uniref:Uncharacterized protein n=1 Tax=Eretmocerus hayati TaxID=131215 RepID=A0ACC2P855_9HYME|nr:hypothetical protein QAD02_015249 [Eretmocerus hayati]
MYHYLVILLQLLLFSSLNAEDLSAKSLSTPLSFHEEVSLKAQERAEEFCKNKSVSLEEYPYYATITSTNCVAWWSYPVYGAIISDRYVLTATRQDSLWKRKGCTFKVKVGSDITDSHVIEHEARIIIDGDITLFKLESPIKFGRRAQKIELAGESPQSKESALITIFDKDHLESTEVYAYNVTVLSDRDCMRLISDQLPSDIERCTGSLWIKFPQIMIDAPLYPFCSLGRYEAMIDRHGKLAGIENHKAAFGLGREMKIDSLLDIARYRVDIEKHTGIKI